MKEEREEGGRKEKGKEKMEGENGRGMKERG